MNGSLMQENGKGTADMAAVQVRQQGADEQTISRNSITFMQMRVQIIDHVPDSISEEKQAEIEERLYRIFRKYL